MAQLKVYHNPEFLRYGGDHAQIPLPARPVAAVDVPDGLSPAEMLEFAYMKTQHGHQSWYHNPEVTAYLRSTSVGDLIADADGKLHVVEAIGFLPYQPSAIASQVDASQVDALPALTSVGHPGVEPSILWADARPGDLVSDQEGDRYRVIARRLVPRQRAERLLTHIPNGQIRPDGAQAWAVLVPTNEEAEP